MKNSNSLSGRTFAALCLIVSAALTLLPFLIRPVYYMVADDYLLNYIANGSYGTDGSAHLVYIRVILGGLLKGLYTLTTAVNWFLVLLLVLLILSFAVLYYTAGQLSGSLLPLLPIAAVNASVVIFFLTYTVVAFIVCAAGAALWYRFLLEGGVRRGRAFLGSFLLVMALCLREDSVLPSLILASPLFLHVLVRTLRAHRLNRAETLRDLLKHTAAPLILLGALLLVTGAAEHLAYSDAEWKDFMEYTDARAAVVDYPSADYAAHAEEFEALGLTKLDYDLLRAWKYCEKPVYTTEALRAAAEIGAEGLTVENRLSYTGSTYTFPVILLVLLPVCLLLLCLLLLPGYPLFAGLLTVCLYEAVTWALIFIRMRFVIRVAVPLAMLAAFTLCLLQTRGEDTAGRTEDEETAAAAASGRTESGGTAAAEMTGFKLPKALRCAAAAAILLFALYGSFTFLKDYRANNWVSRVAPDAYPKSQVTEAIYEDQDSLYILDAGLLSILYYFGVEAKDVLTTDRFANVARSGSWDSFSPRYYAQVRRYLADPDRLLTSLGTEDHVIYVATAEGAIRDFLREQTGRNFEPEIREFQDMATKFYRYRSAE